LTTAARWARPGRACALPQPSDAPLSPTGPGRLLALANGGSAAPAPVLAKPPGLGASAAAAARAPRHRHGQLQSDRALPPCHWVSAMCLPSEQPRRHSRLRPVVKNPRASEGHWPQGLRKIRKSADLCARSLDLMSPCQWELIYFEGGLRISPALHQAFGIAARTCELRRLWQVGGRVIHALHRRSSTR
jgi:hypothetical protein